MNQVKVFWGSKKDFNAFLEKENLDELGGWNSFYGTDSALQFENKTKRSWR